MKKTIKNLLSGLSISLMVALTLSSCKKTDVADATVTVSANPSTTTIKTGTTITLTLNFVGNSDNQLKSYKLTRSGVSTNLVSKDLTGTSAVDYFSETLSTAGTYTYIATLTSAKGDVTTSLQITVVTPTPTVNKSFSLGNQTSGTPRFFSCSKSSTYNLSDAVGNATLQAALDFGYCTRASGGNKIIAPNSADATAIYSSAASSPQWSDATTSIHNWTTRNATTFIKVTSVTASQLAATGADINALISTAVSSGAPTADAISVVAGDVVLFKTASGKYGLIVVSTANGSYTTSTQAGDASLIAYYQN